MRCPSLSELPPPPPDKIGWPWTEDCPQLSDTMPNGCQWPRFSIVTPSYNQGQFIEETIRSVLLQGYPDVEYLIIDGGSSDRSPDIIHRYEPWLTYWISKPDQGQSDAIGRGFARSTGEMIAWMNSDDLYLPGAFYAAAINYCACPGCILAGNVTNFDQRTGVEHLVRQRGITLENMVKFWERRSSWQPSGLFIPRGAYVEAGGMDISLVYLMDRDLICRLLGQGVNVVYLDVTIAKFRLHPSSKTCSQAEGFAIERSIVSRRYWHLISNIIKKDHDSYMLKELGKLALGCFRQRHMVRGLSLLFMALRIGYRVAPRTLLNVAWQLIVEHAHKSSRFSGRPDE